MFRLLRLIFWTAVLVGVIYFAFAVRLGKRTLAGHLANVWRSPQAGELREGAREAAGPLVEKVKQGALDLLRDGGIAPDAHAGGGPRR